MASYSVGQLVRLSVAFTISGVATDPTTVTLKVKDPTGTETTYTYAAAQIVKDSTGNYHMDYTVPAHLGYYFYGYEGAGTVIASSESSFAGISNL